MGLTIGVGWLARDLKEDGGDIAELRKPYDMLNEVLSEAGMAPHHEPHDLPSDEVFEAEMWGYGGLHAIRRLAAYHVCEGRLPPQGSYEDYVSDPVIERLDQEHLRSLDRRNGGLLKRWMSARRSIPKFQHLLLHSDCEGFYLPYDFQHVVFDNAQPQRDGIGGMIGSSPRLLQECIELAALIELPKDIGVESEEIWKNADNPSAEGRLWQVYGVEAFGLVRLIRGCELSIKHSAALVFG
ncbi:hypothetical protein ADU59_06485 [Pararhizobium polonicum]|uniref:Uncharacterized protein n=1 Tax=Pararhizobium polonicum TaxID=1612624 RepID=A0A1C7P404_9HYPH|nr:hypothetical protein [Pararhizobium polonicum]OBZ96023.1 hypothetical protein ADU59_06485 [Pararhizobium polonicum]